MCCRSQSFGGKHTRAVCPGRSGRNDRGWQGLKTLKRYRTISRIFNPRLLSAPMVSPKQRQPLRVSTRLAVVHPKKHLADDEALSMALFGLLAVRSPWPPAPTPWGAT